MATSIIPKSEIRVNNSIAIQYGAVPAVEKDGQWGWGLPGGRVTFCKEEAKRFAKKLNQEILSRMRDPRQLLTAAT